MRVALDDNFDAGAHAGHEPGEVAGSFFFRDVDCTVGHSAIIPSSFRLIFFFGFQGQDCEQLLLAEFA